jgi:hypothetical protein
MELLQVPHTHIRRKIIYLWTSPFGWWHKFAPIDFVKLFEAARRGVKDVDVADNVGH